METRELAEQLMAFGYQNESTWPRLLGKVSTKDYGLATIKRRSRKPGGRMPRRLLVRCLAELTTRS